MLIKKQCKKLAYIVLFINSFFFGINSTLAEVLEREKSVSVTIPNPLGTTNIIQVINNIINYLIYVSVPLLAIMILIGGFQILTAREDPKKVENGKKTIFWAVIGFVIVLISKGAALILLTIMK